MFYYLLNKYSKRVRFIRFFFFTACMKIALIYRILLLVHKNDRVYTQIVCECILPPRLRPMSSVYLSIFKYYFYRIERFDHLVMISSSIKSLVLRFGLVLAFGSWGEYLLCILCELLNANGKFPVHLTTVFWINIFVIWAENLKMYRLKWFDASATRTFPIYVSCTQCYVIFIYNTL